jgi:crotonobetainyl-CoA:carnitine CoA-transferase CaiB-like acyl-CoA transferase
VLCRSGSRDYRGAVSFNARYVYFGLYAYYPPRAADVLAAPINDIPEVAEDPQIRHNDIEEHRQRIEASLNALEEELDAAEAARNRSAIRAQRVEPGSDAAAHRCQS